MLELYRNIREYRLAKKMTQAELAEKAGYTDRSSIARIEKGEIDLPQSKIILIAKALNVDAGILMGNDGIVVEQLPEPNNDDVLLAYFHQLNADGQQRAINALEELTEITRYKEEA